MLLVLGITCKDKTRGNVRTPEVGRRKSNKQMSKTGFKVGS